PFLRGDDTVLRHARRSVRTAPNADLDDGRNRDVRLRSRADAVGRYGRRVVDDGDWPLAHGLHVRAARDGAVGAVSDRCALHRQFADVQPGRNFRRVARPVRRDVAREKLWSPLCWRLPDTCRRPDAAGSARRRPDRVRAYSRSAAGGRDPSLHRSQPLRAGRPARSQGRLNTAPLVTRLRARNEWQFFAVLPRADGPLAAAWWIVLLLRGT